MMNHNFSELKLLIIIGVLITLFLGILVILFIIYFQRKMLLKEKKIKEIEREKELQMVKATIEAEEKQKEKIVNNLHDEIKPLLVLLKHNIDKNTVKSNSKPELELIDKIIEGIRTSCLDLIPAFLSKFGLAKSLEDYLIKLDSGNDIVTEFENKINDTELNKFTKEDILNIYRICLETTSNLIKYSDCSFLKIKIESSDDKLIISFFHNGILISNHKINELTEKSKGLGLKSLKTRTLILNATIDYSTDQNNPAVKFSIPFPL